MQPPTTRCIWWETTLNLLTSAWFVVNAIIASSFKGEKIRWQINVSCMQRSLVIHQKESAEAFWVSWSDRCMQRLAWEHLDVSLDKLEEVGGEREFSASLLRLLSPWPNFRQAEEKRWMTYLFVILDLNFHWSGCHEFSNSVQKTQHKITLFSHGLFIFQVVICHVFNNPLTCLQ